jgi:hypothetical protein
MPPKLIKAERNRTGFPAPAPVPEKMSDESSQL